MYEVELHRNGEKLLSHYKTEFEARYKAEPYTTDKDAEITRWAVKALKPDRAMDLITEYLGMSDEWFLKQSHSLLCFQKNVNRVLGSLGAKEHRTGQSKRNMIRTIVSCDRCHNHYWLTCSIKDLDDPGFERLCDNCANS